MTTRTINIALVEQVPQQRRLEFTPDDVASLGGSLLLENIYSTTTNDSGVGTIDLPCKPSGGILWHWEILGFEDGPSTGSFYLAAGGAVDFDSLAAGGDAISDSVQDYVDAAIAAALSGFTADATESIEIICGDRLTPLVVATNVGSCRMPFSFTLSGIRASLDVAQASGSIFTANVKESGTTIFSTRITIDNGELTSFTAATPAVISDADLADDALITVDVTQIGSGDAAGLRVRLIGTKAA